MIQAVDPKSPNAMPTMKIALGFRIIGIGVLVAPRQPQETPAMRAKHMMSTMNWNLVIWSQYPALDKNSSSSVTSP
jgi:hypothetical protein